MTDIILFDIIGFSKLSNEKQFVTAVIMTKKLKEIVRILTSQAFLQQHEVVLDFIPTGDGFYVLLQPEFAGYGIFLAISVRSSLLLSSKQAKDLFSGVRAAVHLGDALPFWDITDRINFVGNGLNDCARLLCAKPDQSTIKGIPEHSNLVVASEPAYQWFQQTYPHTDEMKVFFNTIGFRSSDRFEIVDKHSKKHRAYFIECSRHAAIKPPAPPDLQERLEKLEERIRKENLTLIRPPAVKGKSIH